MDEESRMPVDEKTADVAVEMEAVIGLETHVELATATKLFCGCPNEFGSEPNTNVCPVCLGLPGSLPVLNAQAVDFALRLAEALGFDVPDRSIFARKNYFYPDMPKDYQVSQYEDPILSDGRLEVDGVVVGIERAHLEEDTGKTVHVGGGGRIHEADYSLVDYNRAGVPLMEIVTRPDIRTAEQARAYVAELRAVLRALGISDVKMEEGSMRVDANVSVRRRGTSELGTKVEVKNMNSLRSLGRAIEYEIERQIAMLEAGERIVQETRHWDEADGRTHGMRTKEGSSDYRYFPEPSRTCPSCRPRSAPGSSRSGGSRTPTRVCSSTCPRWPSTPKRRCWRWCPAMEPLATSSTGARATSSRT
jgi:aspartyl-tRNA(Asn)/glutamyl-tRNA(Gln) amidotransferase subunit B